VPRRLSRSETAAYVGIWEVKQQAYHAEADVRPLDSAFMWRVFYAFAALALLSVAISVGGKWLGKSIAMAGHTDDATIHQIVIGNNVISAPANAIRFERDRRDRVADRLDLYLHWPDMRGYSAAVRNDFNNVSGMKRIIFVSFEERMMSRDMSGRFEPIYHSLIDAPGKSGPAGITYFNFSKKSGYMNEALAVAARPGKEPFVARCLSGPSAEESLAPCERDIHVGDELSLSYRFPVELLKDWQALDQAVMGQAKKMIRTGAK
jgi:hypothetical protein